MESDINIKLFAVIQKATGRYIEYLVSGIFSKISVIPYSKSMSSEIMLVHFKSIWEMNQVFGEKNLL